MDEWLASWSPRVDMEKKSKKNRLQKDLEKLKNGEIVEKNGYYRNEHRFLPRSYLAKNILEEKNVNENGEEDSVSDNSDKQSSVKSGSALRETIRLKETLGYIKSALVPSSGTVISPSIQSPSYFLFTHLSNTSLTLLPLQ